MCTFIKSATVIAAAMALNASMVQAAEVELVDTFNISMSTRGIYSYNESYTVAVDNLSPNKTVFIHREKADGNWVDMPMYYAGPAGDGKEYWKTTDDHDDNGAQFVVGMTANGTTYWDNNNGQNYHLLDPGYSLGANKKVVVDQISEAADEVRVKMVVDNIAPAKSVKLIYSTDNWQSSSEVDASYDGITVIYGYGSYPNPNRNNAESWTAVLPIASSVTAQFYIAYSVNGETYYDNNYGDNYTANPNYESIYTSMNLRTGPNWLAGLPMTLVADNTWAINTEFRNEAQALKFDAYNDWSVNFGDNDKGGFVEQNGNNIPAPQLLGRYRITFNELTGGYILQPYGLTD